MRWLGPSVCLFALASTLFGCVAPKEPLVSVPAPPEPACDTRVAARMGLGSPACIAPPGLPADVAKARTLEAERLEHVVRAWTQSMHGDWDDLGAWRRDAAKTGLRKIMAGLKALQILPEGDPERPPPDFPESVERWLTAHAVAHCRAGTDTQSSPVRGVAGDYDFTMIQILELIYHFRDEPELLSNDAIWALLYNEKHVERVGRAPRSITRIPAVGNVPHQMTFEVVVHFPETENHVLMVNTWAYLVNQWLERNWRGDRRVQRYFERSRASFRNEASALERTLLAILARPLHAGFFETNARPYSAYSLRALQLLYSYADTSTAGGRRIKLAAGNALDYAAATFAFQSFEGKRYGPSRRNYRYRQLFGVYEGDYVSQLFGVLTGAFVYDDRPDCRGARCAYRNPQARGFALESALSRYRVPEPIWDFMLHPDNHRPGHGAWVRMQPRYSERHYLQGKWPRYPGLVPELGRALDQGRTAIEPAPEFYFITQSYMNSAGGRAEHYAGMDAWLPAALRHENDVFSKPSTLMLPGNTGYWSSFAELADDTLAFPGDVARPYASNNTGVYKNLVYGYSTGSGDWPMRLPVGWTLDSERGQGALSLSVLDLSLGNVVDNPKLGLYIVLGRFQRPVGAGAAMGFWEVLPEAEFASPSDVFECVSAKNRGRRYPLGGPYDYTLCASGDTLRLNPRFGKNDNAFLQIEGSPGGIAREHTDLGDQSALRALPLLEAREVDARYRYTGVTYAYAAGDGRLTIDNPHLGQRLVLDSRNPRDPRRSFAARGP